VKRRAHEERGDARARVRRGSAVGESSELFVTDDEDTHEGRETRRPEDPRDRRRDGGRDQCRDRFTELSTPEPHDDEHDRVDLEGRGESHQYSATAALHDERVEYHDQQQNRRRLSPDEAFDLDRHEHNGRESEPTTYSERDRPVSRRQSVETDRERHRKTENAQPRPQEGNGRRRQPDQGPEQENRPRRVGERLDSEGNVNVAGASQRLKVGDTTLEVLEHVGVAAREGPRVKAVRPCYEYRHDECREKSEDGNADS